MALPISVRPAGRLARSPLAPARGDRPAVRAAALAFVLAAAGVTPVTLIAASTWGVALRDLALHAGVPAVAVVAVVAARRRQVAVVVRSAVVTGVAATAAYDLLRLAFMWAGVVDRDPIPHIGVELGLDPAVVFGYLWRYLGNGTGLALAFWALGFRGARAGSVYGLGVCAGLLVTLAVSPHGQEVLFPLSAGTVVMATSGHLAFGAVLGTLSARRDRGVSSR